MIAFHLQPGQEVKPHRSSSTVLVQVVDGEGDFSGDGQTLRPRAGEAAVYERDEMHSIRTGDAPLRFLTLITPRPG